MAAAFIYLFPLKDTCCQHYFGFPPTCSCDLKVSPRFLLTHSTCQAGCGFDLSVRSLQPHLVPLVHLFSQCTAVSRGLGCLSREGSGVGQVGEWKPSTSYPGKSPAICLLLSHSSRVTVRNWTKSRQPSRR